MACEARASIQAVEYHLPERLVSNSDLAIEFPEWPVEKIEQKTGIDARRVTAPGECASDLAAAAAEKVFASGACRREDVDYLLLCTQSPDFFLPTTACVLQERLGLPKTAGALDFNLGCSGYVYGLGLAKGLVETGQARNVLLVTAETYSKHMHPRDKSVRTIFGDGAAATLVSAGAGEPAIGPFVYGTDGSGAANLIIPAGGMREPRSAETAREFEDSSGNTRSRDHLFMDGAEIFAFTLRAVPAAVEELLARAAASAADVDLFVFHQANRYMLTHLRKRLKVPEEKFPIVMSHCGNTVSSTIPIVLKHAMDDGSLREGMTVMLVGFGVGYSWGATLLRWTCAPPKRVA